MPDPRRMVEGYNQSAATLNLLRAFTKGGYADLTQVHLWNQEFVARARPRAAATSGSPTRSSARCSSWPRAASTSPPSAALHEVDFFTSHEGLLLDYEEGLTRRDSLTGDWYDCSAHLLWIGERTRQLDGAHVEFFSGVHNPLGVKLGPTATPDEVVELCERLNPDRVPGPADVRSRAWAPSDVAGAAAAAPARGRATRRIPVVWACDPMHANTIRTADGLKTRRFDDGDGRDRGLLRRLLGGGRAGRAACTSSSPART